ncbi:HEAT repeat domain-containing protein [Streptomyces sp. TE5632]
MNEDVVSGETAAVRLARGAALGEVLDIADPSGSAWISLDEGVRASAWCRPAPLPDAGSVELPEESWLALALCHPDGRIRERALAGVAEHPALLPLIVVRAADWAGPVRERARQLLGEALAGEVSAERVVSLAPLVLRVARRERGDFGLELLGTALRRAPHELLLPLCAHPDRLLRRFAFRAAVEGGLLSPGELARHAARDDDAVVQTLCADAALAAPSTGDGRDDWDDVLEPLLGARNPRARSAGVTALRRAGRPERAVEFLADRSAVVRACARYVLRQHGTDPLPWYRERCTDPAVPPGAVIGLAECGQRADAELLWPLLAHPAPAVRARAVAGLRTLDVSATEQLLPLLDDPASGVVREAAASLLPLAGALPAGRLLGLLDSGCPRHVRVTAFRLLDARGGVIGLRAAVTLLEDPDDKLRMWAGQSVQRWHPAADTRPGDPEVGELLDRAGHLFSEYVLKRRKWEAGLPS